MTIETTEDQTQLVRRRSAWRGPRVPIERASMADEVILVKGKFDLSFSFSEIGEDGRLVWRDRWSGEKGLPRSVRLNLRDDITGLDLLAGAEFLIRADAPWACTSGEKNCLGQQSKTDGTKPDQIRQEL